MTQAIDQIEARHSDEIPASRLMRERDQARTEAAERMRRQLDAEADSARLRQRILEIRAENDRLAERLDAAIAREVAAYDRANVIARERGEARALASREEKTSERYRDDLRHAHAEINRLKCRLVEAEASARNYRSTHERAQEIAEKRVEFTLKRLRSELDTSTQQAREYRDTLVELLQNDAVGQDCPECLGHGGFGDDLDNWDECDAGCFEGRVAK